MGGKTGRPVRLTVLLQDLEFGGTQRYAVNLLKHIDRRRFTPELWVLRGGTGMAPAAVETGVPITWLTRDKGVFPRALFKLAMALKRRPPEMLYTLTVVPNIWGRLFAQPAGVRYVVSGYRNLFPRQYERFLWPLCDRVICNAHVLKEIMVKRRGVDPDRVAVIPNAVDTDHFQPQPGLKDPRPTILFLGRLIPDKDPLGLVAAFKMVAAKAPQARLIMAGAGPLRPRIQQAAAEYGLAGRVELLAPVRDVRPLLGRAWVLALPSPAGEGSPNVVVEAMAAGLPAVVTPLGGSAEVVENGVTGRFVPRNNPHRLAEVLWEMISNHDRRRAMGEAARRKAVDEHAIGRIVGLTQDVLEGVLENPGRKTQKGSGAFFSGGNPFCKRVVPQTPFLKFLSRMLRILDR